MTCATRVNGFPSLPSDLSLQPKPIAIAVELIAHGTFEIDPASHCQQVRRDHHVAEFVGELRQRRVRSGASGNPVSVGDAGATLHSFTDTAIASPAGQVAALRASDTGLRAVLYPIGEAQGTRNVLDANGAPTQAIGYDAYGNITSDSGVPKSLTYWPYQWNGGRVLDGLDLVSIGKRVLDSRTGRFLQRDPVMNPASALAAHPYAFAWNDPVSFVDVTGAEPEVRADIGSAVVGANLGRFHQSHSDAIFASLSNQLEPGPTTDPYIDTSFACDFDHNCMRAVEEATGGLTDFEQQLKAEFHVTKKSVWRWTTQYHVVKDRLSGAVLGYAFFMNNIEIYDRSGATVAMINNERSLETPVLDPIDFAAAGMGNFVRKKITGFFARESGPAIESKVAQSEGAAGEIAVTPRPPPFQSAPPGGNILKGALGGTTPWGDIYISSRLVPGSAEFITTLRHEFVHRLLSPRITSLFGYRRGLMKAWFYKNSHLLRYTEEALAESYATRSLVWRLSRYPLNAIQPPIRAGRLVLEGGLYTGVLGGAFAGGVGLSQSDRP
jgi:RHS repeat-associated protein